MRILFIGDIVGEPGRRAVAEILPRLRREHEVDLVIANGENSAGGSGITAAIAQELYSYGVNIITTGIPARATSAASCRGPEGKR